MNCKTAIGRMNLAVHGDLDPIEEQALAAHCAACASCAAEAEQYSHLRQILQLAGPDLSVIEESLPGPDAELTWQRNRLMAALAAHSNRSTRTWNPGRLVWATSLIFVGLTGGWMMRGLVQVQPHASEVPADNAAVRIDAIEPASGDGKVVVYYALTENRSLQASPADPVVQRLLLQAMQHPANAGVQLDAAAALGRVLVSDGDSPAVEATLLQALRNDPNPGVRLQALEALAPLIRNDSPQDTTANLRNALASAVLHDEDFGIRSEAIGALAQAPQAEAVPLLEEIGQKTSDAAVRLSCAASLQRMQIAVPASWLATPASWTQY